MAAKICHLNFDRIRSNMTTNFAKVSIQNVRDYWNTRPCNIRHSQAEIGTERYFNQVEARKYFVEPHIPGFAEFDRWRGKRVLEIGCGIATDTINFARAGAHVTAVDISDESLKLARRRAEILGLSDRIDFVEADAEELSRYVPAERYDLVYSFGVIHHSPTPRRIITQIRESFSGPGTTLKIMVYHRYSLKVLRMLMRERFRFWKLDAIVAKHSEAQTGCPVTYSYSKNSVRKLVGNGFVIDDIFVDHIFQYRVSQYVKYQYEKEWIFRIMPGAVLRAMERRLGWHLCVTATAK